MTIDAGERTRHADGGKYEPITVRVVATIFPKAGTAKRGVTLDGWQVELFAVDLPAEAFPAADVVAVYFGRTALENRFMQDDLKPAIGDVHLEHIGDEHVDAVKTACAAFQASTVNATLSTLCALLRFAEDRKVIAQAPKIKRLKTVTPKAAYYDDETFYRLVEAARRVDAKHGGNHELLICLAGDAGLRCGELLALEPRHLRIRERAVRVELNEYQHVVGTPKGGVVEDVPMSARLLEACDRADLTRKRVLARHGRRQQGQGSRGVGERAPRNPPPLPT